MKYIKKFLKVFAKILTIAFALLAFALLFISLFKKEWIEAAIAWMETFIHTLGNWNYFIAFASACIESLPIIGVLVPGMNVMIIVGGFWGKTHMLGTMIMAVIGAMLGNYLGYFLGKYYGKELIHEYGDWVGLGKTEVKILEGQIQRNGFWYIVLGKFHNFTRSFIPFIAGGSGMQEKNFWIYNTVGSIIWAVSINLLGIFFTENYKTILENFGKIFLVILVGIVIYIYFFKKEAFIQYWKDKEAEMNERFPTAKK